MQKCIANGDTSYLHGSAATQKLWKRCGLGCRKGVGWWSGSSGRDGEGEGRSWGVALGWGYNLEGEGEEEGQEETHRDELALCEKGQWVAFPVGWRGPYLSQGVA